MDLFESGLQRASWEWLGKADKDFSLSRKRPQMYQRHVQKEQKLNNFYKR